MKTLRELVLEAASNKTVSVSEGKYDKKEVDGWLVRISDRDFGGDTTITSKKTGTVLGILPYTIWNQKEYFYAATEDDQKNTATLADAVKLVKNISGEAVPVAAQEALIHEFGEVLSKGFKGLREVSSETDSDDNKTVSVAEEAPADAPVAKKRGRPAKPKMTVSDTANQTEDTKAAVMTVKRSAEMSSMAKYREFNTALYDLFQKKDKKGMVELFKTYNFFTNRKDKLDTPEMRMEVILTRKPDLSKVDWDVVVSAYLSVDRDFE